jgi:hypothetical protein
MNTEHIVALLIAERDKLNRAIEALGTSVKRPGRPPKNPLAAALATLLKRQQSAVASAPPSVKHNQSA